MFSYKRVFYSARTQHSPMIVSGFSFLRSPFLSLCFYPVAKKAKAPPLKPPHTLRLIPMCSNQSPSEEQLTPAQLLLLNRMKFSYSHKPWHNQIGFYERFLSRVRGFFQHLLSKACFNSLNIGPLEAHAASRCQLRLTFQALWETRGGLGRTRATIPCYV